MATTGHPYFSYRDVAGALDWLERAFGFERLAVQAGPDGRVMHAEMRLGEAVIMMGEADALHAPPGPQAKAACPGVYLAMDEIDAHHARAVSAGARIVFPPEDTGWGARRYRALDPEGYEWSFGTYRPGGV